MSHRRRMRWFQQPDPSVNDAFEWTPVRRDSIFCRISYEGTFEGVAPRVSSLDGSWAPPSTGFAYKKCCFETADRPPVLAEGNRTTVDSWVTNPRDYNTSTTAMSVLALFHHLPNMICNECRRYLTACRKALDISELQNDSWKRTHNGNRRERSGDDEFSESKSRRVDGYLKKTGAYTLANRHWTRK